MTKTQAIFRQSLALTNEVDQCSFRANELQPASLFGRSPHYLLVLQAIEAANELAWIYATHHDASLRNGMEAVRLAELACAETYSRHSVFLDTLGAAYAEAGRFEDAIKTMNQAIELVQASNSEESKAWQKIFESRRKLYQAGKPFREAPHAVAAAQAK